MLLKKDHKRLFLGASLLLSAAALVVAASMMIEPRPAMARTFLNCLPTTPQGRYEAEPPCLKTAVKDLMREYSTQEVLEYISAPPTPVSVHIYAHSIAHFVGVITYDQSRSIEEALDKCYPDSQYGCMHGVIGAAAAAELGSDLVDEKEFSHVSLENVQEIAGKYCASNNLQLCHAVGHVLFQIFQEYAADPGSNEPYSKALDTCTRSIAGNENKQEACARGIFMESAGPVTSFSPDKSLPVGTRPYEGVCASIPTAYRHACFRYLPRTQQLLFEKNKIHTAGERLQISRAVCEKLTDPARASCVESLGLNSKRVFADPGRPNRHNFCDQFAPRQDKQACILGVVGSFLDTFDYPGAVKYCADMDDQSSRDFCFPALFKVASQVTMGAPETPGSVMRDICAEKRTSTLCRLELQKYLNRTDVPNYLLGLHGGEPSVNSLTPGVYP